MKHLLLVVFSLIATSGFASQRGVIAKGGSSSGGGDNLRPETGSAWFLQRTTETAKTIKYCYESSSTFGVPNAQLESAIGEAFSIWGSYITDKAVNSHIYSQFHAAIVSSGALSPKCDGTEDLKIYFGVTDSLVQKYKSKYENPSAFAERIQYDTTSAWGKGFIWFAPPSSVDPQAGFPDWTRNKVLIAMLLHEIGHVLGCGHVDNTIMDENLSPLLKSDGYPLDYREKIDYKNELTFAHKKQVEYAGFLGVTDLNSGESEVETFHLFFGRDPIGKVSARLIQSWSTPTIVVTDDAGTNELKLDLLSGDGASFGGDSSAFKGVFFNPTLNTVITVAVPIYGSVLYAKTKSVLGQDFNLAMEDNTHVPNFESRGSIKVKFFNGSKIQTLFRNTLN